MYVKNAMRVHAEPAPRLSCTYVMSEGGTKTHGKVCFDPISDFFWVKDMKADGMSIYMRALYAGNPQTIFDCRNFEGAAAGWTACYFDNEMKEGRTIAFAALAYKGNDLKYKSVTATAEN
ncbi:hypothetical protein [Streptomyces sp. NPDC050355]|uniref:hypothetical protein n=1 Tax=Streptomyces sp. NPDC050355 TaxID=3365609 RepID=UPI0037A5510C